MLPLRLRQRLLLGGAAASTPIAWRRRRSNGRCQMERLLDSEIGIDKYFSFGVLKSPVVKAHLPLASCSSSNLVADLDGGGVAAVRH